jgi:hypothetical protein
MNKYWKVAIPENEHNPNVWCSVRGVLRSMRGKLLTTLVAGISSRFPFSITLPNDSNPEELYQPATLFSASVFMFIFCCVTNLLFHKIEIFYLDTWILILKLPKEALLDCFGLCVLSTVPTNHNVGQVISALLAKAHPSGCKGSRCSLGRSDGEGPEYRVSENCETEKRHFPACTFVYLATDESNVTRLTLCFVASCNPQACWENALQYVAWRIKKYTPKTNKCAWFHGFMI